MTEVLKEASNHALVVMSSHALGPVKELADSVVIIDGGVLLHTADPLALTTQRSIDFGGWSENQLAISLLKRHGYEVQETATGLGRTEPLDAQKLRHVLKLAGSEGLIALAITDADWGPNSDHSNTPEVDQ